LKEYNGILCCSGDGVLHEVINALYHRNDDSGSYTPLGIIPGGSSNGYAKCICDESKEEYSPEMCAYIIAKGQFKNVDIMEIEMKSSEKKIYASLNITYGLISDIDLNSEV
jgi:sphingosine kinase